MAMSRNERRQKEWIRYQNDKMTSFYTWWTQWLGGSWMKQWVDKTRATERDFPKINPQAKIGSVFELIGHPTCWKDWKQADKESEEKKRDLCQALSTSVWSVSVTNMRNLSPSQFPALSLSLAIFFCCQRLFASECCNYLLLDDVSENRGMHPLQVKYRELV